MFPGQRGVLGIWNVDPMGLLCGPFVQPKSLLCWSGFPCGQLEFPACGADNCAEPWPALLHLSGMGVTLVAGTCL